MPVFLGVGIAALFPACRSSRRCCWRWRRLPVALVLSLVVAARQPGGDGRRRAAGGRHRVRAGQAADRCRCARRCSSAQYRLRRRARLRRTGRAARRAAVSASRCGSCRSPGSPPSACRTAIRVRTMTAAAGPEARRRDCGSRRRCAAARHPGAARRLRFRPRGLVHAARRRRLHAWLGRRSIPTSASRRSACASGPAIERVRHAIGQRITARPCQARPAQIANGLITGERGGISRGDQRRLPRQRPVPHPVDLRPAHGDHGGRRVLGGAGRCWRWCRGSHCGCRSRRSRRSAAIVAALGYLLISGASPRDGAVLDHDLDDVPRGAAGPAGAEPAQRRAVGAGDPGGVPGEPVRRRLPDVVCGGRRAGGGLRSGCASARRRTGRPSRATPW